ncbi:outer membrane lipid asymmetry maintenance protein MlaD [Thiotrichales bacterium 19S9-12]|nr:outer membrane lipid asymmetry maintenance protein MlaD [Thiotrichales bacterium 19S9-11]MCF6811631.1 outer membrane lipid asymmetry maintenance protein MlaD [Thiotrichales bacterium 19S9-12]
MYKKSVELAVGLFVILAMIALIFLAMKVSGLGFRNITGQKTYTVTANFTNIGALKTNAAVRIAGVEVGNVSDISLNPTTFAAVVTFKIDKIYNKIPKNSSASIQTSGLLGESYVGISPGFSPSNLGNGDKIVTTYPAIDFSSLINTFVSSSGEKEK